MVAGTLGVLPWSKDLKNPLLPLIHGKECDNWGCEVGLSPLIGNMSNITASRYLTTGTILVHHSLSVQVLER